MFTIPTEVAVTFAPTEFNELAEQDLTDCTCVVFDVLRATSTMLAAFENGAAAIKPVESINAAIAEQALDPNVLLAGERDGVRIGTELTGGIAFHAGNSPREMTRSLVAGKSIVSTTTNGTRAIRACRHAEHVLIASFGNLSATVTRLSQLGTRRCLIVCSGTGNHSSLEDACGGGALVQRMVDSIAAIQLSDAARIARSIFCHARAQLFEYISQAENARRLLQHPDLADDVAWCLETDRFNFVAELDTDGFLRCHR